MDSASLRPKRHAARAPPHGAVRTRPRHAASSRPEEIDGEIDGEIGGEIGGEIEMRTLDGTHVGEYVQCADRDTLAAAWERYHSSDGGVFGLRAIDR